MLSNEQLENLKTKLIPQNKNIIIIRDEVPTTNNSGLILQNTFTGTKTITGVVVLSDDDAINEGTKIIFGSMCGVNFEVDNISLTSLKKDDIIGKFN
jgi:co-chaperonin GroES (HSP10)